MKHNPIQTTDEHNQRSDKLSNIMQGNGTSCVQNTIAAALSIQNVCDL